MTGCRKIKSLQEKLSGMEREVIELLVSCFFFFFAEVDVKVNLQQKVSQQEHICENHSYHLITEILVAA